MGKLRSINSEPIIFLFSVSLGLYVTVYQAFIKFKLCLPLATAEICRHLENYTDKRLEDIVSADAAHYSLYLQICVSIPSFLVCFFIGAWSDANGRRTPLLIALAGIAFNNVLLIFLAAFHSMPLWLLFVGAFVAGLTGHIIIVFSCCFSMISDSIKDPVMLTIRIGIGSSLVYIGIVVGSLTSSLIPHLTVSPYVYTFLVSACFSAAGVLYIPLFVRETIHLAKSDALIGSSGTDIQSLANDESKTCGASFCDFFHFDRIKESFTVLCRLRMGRRRLHLILSITIFLVIFSCDVGIPGLQYLFVTRKPLAFTNSMYSDLVAVQTASAALGMLILPVILKKVLRLEDTWLITVGFLFSIAKSLTFAFSKEMWMVYLCTFNFGAALYFPGCRAFISKLVERSETARVFALLSAVEQIGPLISGVIFNNVYAATLTLFPGFVWVLGAGIIGLGLIVVCWLQYDSRYENYDNELDDDLSPTLIEPHEVIT